MRHNIAPISAAKSRVLLLGQCRRLHRSSVGLTTAAFIDCLNLPTFNRNLAQYWPYTKLIITFTMASNSGSRRARVKPMDGILLGQVSFLLRQTIILEVRKREFGTALVRCSSEYLIFSDEPCSQRKGQILAQQLPIISSKVCFTSAKHVLIGVDSNGTILATDLWKHFYRF